jgi:hypothetical protein
MAAFRCFWVPWFYTTRWAKTQVAPESASTWRSKAADLISNKQGKKRLGCARRRA